MRGEETMEAPAGGALVTASPIDLLNSRDQRIESKALVE